MGGVWAFCDLAHLCLPKWGHLGETHERLVGHSCLRCLKRHPCLNGVNFANFGVFCYGWSMGDPTRLQYPLDFRGTVKLWNEPEWWEKGGSTRNRCTCLAALGLWLNQSSIYKTVEQRWRIWCQCIFWSMLQLVIWRSKSCIELTSLKAQKGHGDEIFCSLLKQYYLVFL